MLVTAQRWAVCWMNPGWKAPDFHATAPSTKERPEVFRMIVQSISTYVGLPLECRAVLPKWLTPSMPDLHQFTVFFVSPTLSNSTSPDRI